jgi:hypothetical protein
MENGRRWRPFFLPMPDLAKSLNRSVPTREIQKKGKNNPLANLWNCIQ